MNISQESNRNGSVIHKFSRSGATHERNHEVIRSYKPYFWIEDIEDTPSTEYTSLDGIPVKKCFVKNPWDIADVKEIYNHFESDIQYSSRYMLDTATLPLPDDYLRTIFFDLETYTHKGDPFPESDVAPDPICMICTYDTLTEEYRTFQDEDEYELLKSFSHYVQDCDPDVMSSWNGNNFDEPYLYNRMVQCYLNPNMLSPLDRTTYKPEFGVTISGVDLLDLLTLYKRLHAGELESYSLNSVAEHELGSKKIDIGNELPGDMINGGRKKELEEYCLMDVQLLVELDKKLGIVAFYHLLQRLSGLPNIASAVSNSRIHDALILRKAHEQNIILPSKESREKTEVVGARVLDPVPGLHENVAVLDVVGLYSNIFLTTNAGYETVSRNPQPNSIKIETDSHTLYVDQSKKSLWCEVLEDLMGERMKHKHAMQTSTVDSDEYEYHHTIQFAIKTLIASAYGVSNFSNFRLYSSDVSNIITFMGREMNKHMQGVVENEGYTCVGGDTDSLFVSMGSPDVSVAINLADIVNNTWGEFVAPMGLQTHSFELEYDSFYDRFFSVSKKKRYAGHYIHKNGEVADDIKIVGFQYKRSDTSRLSKNLQERVFGIILGDPLSSVENNVKKEIKLAIDGLESAEYRDIGIPHGFKKNPIKYAIQTLYTKGALYSMEHFGMGGYETVKPIFFSIKRVKPESNLPDTKTVAIDPADPNQMEILKSNFDLDYGTIEKKIIRKPLELIVEALNIDFEEITTGTKQSSLFGF